MPTVTGIVETAVYSKDLRSSLSFYQGLFGFNVLLESPRLVALDVAGRNVLLLFQSGETQEPLPTAGGLIPGHGDGGSGHFAFGIEKSDVDRWKERLMLLEVQVESEVAWEHGAVSLYFRDPDQNLVELITRGFWPTY